MERHVRIFDTTLRDGEQTPGVHLTADRKLVIAQQLEAFGVDTVEAGFPVSSPGEAEAVARIAKTLTKCEVAALARCTEGDVDAAARAVEYSPWPVVHVFLGVSDIHLTRKLRISRAEALRAIERAVKRAARHSVAVEFSPEDATRAERPFLRQCVEVALACGATRINLPDTVGCATPSEYGTLIRDMVAFVDGVAWISAHCHNDMGLATANTLAAIEAGARQVEVTVNGLGERAGNAAVEEVGVAIRLKNMAQTRLDLSRVVALSRLVAETTGVAVQPNRAIVGANAFAHSSGIHQDGIIKDAGNYEFVSPQLVGADGHTFVLTARSGRSAVVHHARRLGYDLTPSEAEAAYAAFLAVAEQTEGRVEPTVLDEVIRRACPRCGAQSGAAMIPVSA